MSRWPSVSFENSFLQQLALELRKRAQSIQSLVSALSGQRIDDIEELGGAGGGIEHQGLALKFSLWGEPAPRVYITIYDNHTFILRVLQPYVSVDGQLPHRDAAAVASLIENTLRTIQQGADDVCRLWR